MGCWTIVSKSGPLSVKNDEQVFRVPDEFQFYRLRAQSTLNLVST